MTAFRASAAGLLHIAADGTLTDRIVEQVRRGAAPPEKRSWARSLPVLARDLVDAGLGEVEMLVEYQLPLNSKRVDVILAGTHPRGGDSFVVVELKQWSAARSYEGSERLVEVDYVARPRLHPGLQVEGYCDYLVDFLGALHDVGDRVRGSHICTTPRTEMYKTSSRCRSTNGGASSPVSGVVSSSTI